MFSYLEGKDVLNKRSLDKVLAYFYYDIGTSFKNSGNRDRFILEFEGLQNLFPEKVLEESLEIDEIILELDKAYLSSEPYLLKIGRWI